MRAVFAEAMRNVLDSLGSAGDSEPTTLSNFISGLLNVYISCSGSYGQAWDINSGTLRTMRSMCHGPCVTTCSSLTFLHFICRCWEAFCIRRPGGPTPSMHFHAGRLDTATCEASASRFPRLTGSERFRGATLMAAMI